jgi:outer membrane protein, protease secretion system
VQGVFISQSLGACAARTVPTGLRLRTILLAMSLGAALITPRPAHALGLADVYEAALGHDPVIAGAAKQKEADDANVAIGRSYLLPNVSANYARYRDVTGTTMIGQGPQGEDLFLHQVYGAYSEGISLRQPVINF